jgi:hypothetical protein
LLTSELFCVRVGKRVRKQARFTVHVAAIADWSPALKSMTYGGFAENTSKPITFEDVDDDTFSRFCQFAYKRDYQPPPSDFEDDETVKGDSDAHAYKRTRMDLTVLSPMEGDGSAECPMEDT